MEGRAAHDSLDQVRVMQIAKESVGERHTAKCGGLSTFCSGSQADSYDLSSPLPELGVKRKQSGGKRTFDGSVRSWRANRAGEPCRSDMKSARAELPPHRALSLLDVRI